MDAGTYARWAGDIAVGYGLSLLIEGCFLGLCLSRRHARRERITATVWLTSCTYPLVAVFFPLMLGSLGRATVLLMAESYAALAEALLFTWAYDRSAPLPERLRNAAVIVAANLTSFGYGEILQRAGWWPSRLWS